MIQMNLCQRDAATASARRSPARCRMRVNARYLLRRAGRFRRKTPSTASKSSVRRKLKHAVSFKEHGNQLLTEVSFPSLFSSSSRIVLLSSSLFSCAERWRSIRGSADSFVESRSTCRKWCRLRFALWISSSCCCLLSGAARFRVHRPIMRTLCVFLRMGLP